MRSSVLLALLLVPLLLHAGPPSPRLNDIKLPSDIAKRAPDKQRLRVVNIWATWCVPCVHEMPDLEKVHRDFRGRGIEIIGVSLDDAIPGDRAETKAKVRRFLSEQKITFTNLYYTGRTPAIAEWFNFSGEIPATLVYDAEGRQRARVEGRIDSQKFRATLERLLAEINKETKR